MNRFIAFFVGCSLFAATLLGVFSLPATAATNEVVNIGILAIRSKTEMTERWQPLADYLSSKVPGGYQFQVVPLDHVQLPKAIQRNELKFILTNPAYYIELRSRYALSSPLATLIDYNKTYPVATYGGVIFTRAERNDINSLVDLRGKKIAIVSPESLGGYQSQALELKEAGIVLEGSANLIQCNLPHERTIDAVLSGKAEVGFIRSGMIEELKAAGRLDPARLKIINQRLSPDYPLLLSTRLYPQWPFLALPPVDEKMARAVAAALLSLEHDSTVAQLGGYHGFTIPADYSSVETLLRTLRLPPFDSRPYFTAADVLQRYQSHFLLSTIIVAIILSLAIFLLFLNRRLAALHQQVSKSEERLREAQRIAHIGNWELNLINNQLVWSDEIFNIFEIDRHKFAANYDAFLNTIHPADRAAVDLAYKISLETRQPYTTEHRLLLPDGRIKYVREEGKSLFDDSGRALRSIGTVQDVSESCQQQQLLHESEERYQLFTELTSDFVHMCERQGELFRIRWLAGSVEKLTGYSEDELMEMGCWLQILYPEDFQRTAEKLKSYAPGDRGTIEFRIIRKGDGEVRWLRERSYGTRDASGNLILYGSISDISEQKRYEVMLLESCYAADAANRAKSEFLANMSHEIRSPMNGIIGMTQLLYFTELTAEQKDYLNNIEISAENLLALINDILDFSKIEAGKIELSPEVFSLHTLISNAVNNQLPRLQAKGVQIFTEIDAEVPDILFGDDLRLKQILINLLNNAIKFTDSGSIAVAVKLCERRGEQVILSFSVKDSGIGIRAEVLETIFSEFCQGDNSTTRRFGGSGLGLAICRKLLNLMGGKIWVESQEGIGSTFFFDVPFTVEDQVVPADRGFVSTELPVSLQNGQSLKILIAEDNEINMRFAVMLLHKLGHTTVQAANGVEAVEQWRTGHFDVILMDIQMPEMDGIEALQIIRRDEVVNGQYTPVIALTAHAMIGDRERFLADGFDGYITKPFALDRLIEVFKGINPERDMKPQAEVIE